MKFHPHILAFAVLAGGMLPAQAADYSVVSEPTVYDWSGPYAGLHAGYLTGDVDLNGFGPDIGISGVTGGVQAGYNYQFDNYVLGVEGDFSLSNASGNAGGNSAETNWFATIRGRAGYAHNRFLVYATGGLMLMDIEVTTPGPVTSSKVHPGWTIGAGVEGALADGVSLKGEYLYYDVNSTNYMSAFDATGNGHSFRLGLNIALTSVFLANGN